MLAADGAGPRAREEITGGVRWYVVPERLLVDEERWQELMDQGAEELELKLTAEQYAVVRAPGPVLLSGSAGSGKTTIAVHRLAAAVGAAERVRALYLTYSTWLRDHARRLFGDLLACRGEILPASPEFLTVHELYRTLIVTSGGAPPGPVVDYPEFARWYEGQFRRADAALAWEEIRGIVKGASLDPSRSFLSREEYEALGRKRAPAFVAERARLHQVARRWQEHLDAGRRLDEIDLCRLALAAVPADGFYDHLVCDEAQDLAEIQMELLLRLVPGRSLGGLFLAGDPQQVINPSGFRWAEVRSRIRDRFLDRARPAPELVVLTKNFRSVRGLVELANEVLAFKRDRTGRSDGDDDGAQRGGRRRADPGGGRRDRARRRHPRLRSPLRGARRLGGHQGAAAGRRSGRRACSRSPRRKGSSSTSPSCGAWWPPIPIPGAGSSTRPSTCARTRRPGARSITSTWR